MCCYIINAQECCGWEQEKLFQEHKRSSNFSERRYRASVVVICVYDDVSCLYRVSLSTLLVTTAANQEKSIW